MKHTSSGYIRALDLALLFSAPIILHLRVDVAKVFLCQVPEVSCNPGGIDNYIGPRMGPIIKYETVFSARQDMAVRLDLDLEPMRTPSDIS
jgi:hypothetical protein